MNSSMAEAIATQVTVSKDTLTVELADGRTVAVPLIWYPRLTQATVTERKTWRLIYAGSRFFQGLRGSGADWSTPRAIEFKVAAGKTLHLRNLKLKRTN